MLEWHFDSSGQKLMTYPSSKKDANVVVTILQSQTDIVLTVDESEPFDWFDNPYVYFKGERLSDGKRLAIEKLAVSYQMTGVRIHSVVLKPMTPIIIGEMRDKASKISRLAYLPIDSNLVAELGSYRLRMIKKSESSKLEAHLGAMVSVSEISIEGALQPIGDLEKNLCDIIRLIGIMLSTSVKTFETTVFYNDGDFCISQEFNAGHVSKTSETVFQQKLFLEQTYPVWQSLDPSLKEAMYVASQYLGISEDGYLDSRLFAVNQAWELFAKKYRKTVLKKDEGFTKLGKKSRREFEDLKNDLKSSYDSWRNANPENLLKEIFDMGKFIERSRSVTLKSSVEDLVSHTGFDVSATSFDADELRKKTNSVRHTGMLGTDETDNVFQHYKSSKYSLQLIFLKILGYTGKVCNRLGDFQKFDDINDYFSK